MFPSEPRSIQVDFYNNLSDVKISWTEPRVTGKGNLFYLIQIQKNGKGEWKRELSTKEMKATISVPSSGDHVRVCATNNVDHEKVSCSRSFGKFFN